MSSYEPYPYSRTFIVFRDRGGGVWVEMGEETISGTHPIQDDGPCELVIRSFLTRTKSSGGEFAVVPKDIWTRINRNPSVPMVERAGRG